MKNNYNHTITACYIGYITQAVVNNFAPLLFLTFSRQFGLTLDRIALITTVNFAVQLQVDLVSATLIDAVGYRASVIAAHVFSAAGLTALAWLPFILSSPFQGILAAVVLYAVGGGLIEVIVSPIVEACPTARKEAAMSLLHSFYCWGHVAVVVISTVFFRFFGIGHWRVLAVLWAAVPVFNAVFFTRVPIFSITGGKTPLSLRALFRERLFWIFLAVMVCAGASEHAMSQWASAFAESALGVSKTLGDLAGPCSFALLMGISRALYGKYSEQLELKKALSLSAVMCICAYLLSSLTRHPALGLLGCGICGFSVGIFWPGTFSLAAGKLPAAGTAMYAFMALAGDLGCSGGPTLVGITAGALGGDLRRGLLLALVFPALILVNVALLGKEER